MAYKLRKFICLNCDDEFERRKKEAKYCCIDCQTKHSNMGLNFHKNRDTVLEEKIFICLQCHDKFIAKINKDRKFCSNECQTIYLKENKKITGRKKTRIIRIKYCRHCHKEFETKNKNQKYCSRDCWYVSEECRKRTASNPVKYNGVTFRSSWEAIIAEHLDKAQFKYEYEKHKYFINDDIGSYIPDFYIPEKEVFIEVKGQWLYGAKQKVDAFRKCYPEKKLYIIESVDMLSIMMMLQYLYGLSHYDFDSNDNDYIESKVKYTCMLMIDEIIEILRETNYKEHKQKKPIDREHLVEEIIDVYIFVLNLMLLLKVDYKEFKHVFKQKYTLNRFRLLFPTIKFSSISSFINDVKNK